MPSTDERTLRVSGYRELQKAFALASRELITKFRERLRKAAEPVRADAERLASNEIRNIGEDWSKMRVGVTQRSVYVAPVQRGVSGRGQALRRPNLAGLLMDRAMSPALEHNVGRVEHELEDMLDELGQDWGRV